MSVAISQPDILLCILLWLPQKDLLLAQRVCKQWQYLISSTRKLQESLFLSGSSNTATPNQDQVFRLNPLLAYHFPAFFKQTNLRKWPDKPYYYFEPWQDTPWYNDIMIEFRGEPVRRSMVSDRFSRPEASWRRMVPCYPVPREIQLHLNTSPRHRSDRAVFQRLGFPILQTISDKSASYLTFGVIYDIVEEGWFRNWKYRDPVDSEFVHSREVERFHVSFGHSQVRNGCPAFNDRFGSTVDQVRAKLPLDDIGHEDCVFIELLVPLRQCQRSHNGLGPTEQDAVSFRSRACIADMLDWDSTYIIQPSR